MTPPLPADALQRTVAWCNLDDLAYRCTNILRRAFVRLSNWGADHRALGRYAPYKDPAFEGDCQSFFDGNRSKQQSALSLNLADEGRAALPHQYQSFSLASPNKCGNEIIAYQDIGVHDIYDFTVSQHHNYVSRGVIHHNSESGGYETALHLTGDYPEDWTGERFDKPILCWTGSPTNETSRDIIQKALIGGTSPSELGTGFIPKEKIAAKPKMRQAGVSDVVDAFKVRHVSGGVSTVILKTYEQGWRKWQGTAPEVIWLDEEPDDFKIYSEALTRLLTSRGIMMVTFTPLLGQTDLVMHFQNSENEGVWLGHATWEDAPHLLKVERERMKASYREHEVQARTMGVPMMGEGAIFTTSEAKVVCDPIKIPDHWAQIKGVDFGLGHPQGYGKIAWDRDNDVIYLVECYREKDQLAPYHAARINAVNEWIPVAWPHDGHKRDGDGREFHAKYRALHVNMLGRSARYKKETGGRQPEWPIIDEIKDREATGRFKVFSTCTEYLEERRNYHIKEDKLGVASIVNRREDTLKAVFYALMMKRHALSSLSQGRHKAQPPQTSIMSMRR